MTGIHDADPALHSWRGVPLADMSQGELIKLVEHLHRENGALRRRYSDEKLLELATWKLAREHPPRGRPDFLFLTAIGSAATIIAIFGHILWAAIWAS